MLTEIQPPQAEQISAVSTALEAVVRDHGMTDEDVERRQFVVGVMQDLLLSVLPGKFETKSYVQYFVCCLKHLPDFLKLNLKNKMQNKNSVFLALVYFSILINLEVCPSQ